MQNFEKDSAVLRKSDTNEEKKIRQHMELKVDEDNGKEMKGVYQTPFTQSIMEESQQGNRNQGQKQRIQNMKSR